MTRTWTEVGDEALDNSLRRESGRVLDRRAIEIAIDKLDWEEVPEGGSLTLGAMAGMAINATITEFRIPKVTRVAVSNRLAPYGFYGIEGNYKNGRALIYLLDTGTGVTPLASDFYEKEAA